ncbi:uncharacterized protein LOC113505176 [Trichoplusia ni]|uniref:Uncharacterized protein LOC113505176 n=1 Tax=Trichoplusia ni TaxID=7111 RepID=A0A7E5WTE2_TRINI|nr:uncharacterized protein LOC113505176 [Trichoplusia ni]
MEVDETDNTKEQTEKPETEAETETKSADEQTDTDQAEQETTQADSKPETTDTSSQGTTDSETIPEQEKTDVDMDRTEVNGTPEVVEPKTVEVIPTTNPLTTTA